jgi:hypothetical protein
MNLYCKCKQHWLDIPSIFILLGQSVKTLVAYKVTCLILFSGRFDFTLEELQVQIVST